MICDGIMVPDVIVVDINAFVGTASIRVKTCKSRLLLAVVVVVAVVDLIQHE